MTLLFEPPALFDLPLSKGRDLYFEFIYKPLVVDAEGAPVLDALGKKQYAEADFPDGVDVYLEIDTTPVTTVPGVVDGSHAVLHEDYTVVDVIAKGLPWRLKMIDGTRDEVLTHGKTARKEPTVSTGV